MIALKPDKGHLLIAEPSIIGDVSFNRSVVLLADHTDEGSIGFILNKPLNVDLSDLIPQFSNAKTTFKVYNGGPVEQDNLYFIHKIPHLVPNSIEISLGIYWGGDFSSIIKLLEEDKLQQDDIKFFLGYSGWHANQLSEELNSNSWIIVENEFKKEIISKSCKSIWRNKMMEFGGEYLIWSNAPEDPSHN
ncbi:YqgE/AlgH family protein [uncultured Kordia sp.]|uniref:YqgE/AlgH family protein n=1 Tax=uncultured Kordia sp. TaxID=507699 RepID=UPI0026139E1A|nr:YqgE/AlgH family protein [uncultured Kordia sp.]